MVFFDAIRNIFALLPGLTQAAGVELEKKRDRPKLLDVVEARFLSEEARRRNLELGSLIRKDKLSLYRKLLRRGVRRKVEEVVAAHYNLPEIVDEVTEKLTDAASVDPRIHKWFG